MRIEVGMEKGGLFDRSEYFLVEDDVFDIVKRVKEIDPAYFILWNRKKDKYELHHKGQADYTFCLMIPFAELDERTLKLIWDTRAEKAKEIFAQMTAHNEYIERKAHENMKDYVKWVGSEIYGYLNKYYSKETIDKDSRWFKCNGLQ